MKKYEPTISDTMKKYEPISVEITGLDKDGFLYAIFFKTYRKYYKYL